MSALTERFSLTSSLIVLRDTPSRPANASWVNLAAGMISSRNNSPGWVGRNPFFLSTVSLAFSDNPLSSGRERRLVQTGTSSCNYQ